MAKNILRFLLLAGGIAAAILLAELFKNKAIGAFWNITEAA